MNATWYTTPMLMTTMANTVAVRGVPNRAEKKAAMPAMVAVRRSRSSRLNRLPAWRPMVPPIWRAAPSRPALPPHRWVRIVPRKMAGSSQMDRGLPWCTASMMSLVPWPSVLVSL